MSQCQHVNRFAPFHIQDQCQFHQFHIQDCIAALYLKRPHQKSRALAVWLKSFTRWYVVYECIPLFTSSVNSSTEFLPVFILQGGDLGSTYESEYCSWWFEGGVSSSYTQQMETPKRIGSFFEFSTIAPNVINSMSLAF